MKITATAECPAAGEINVQLNLSGPNALMLATLLQGQAEQQCAGEKDWNAEDHRNARRNQNACAAISVALVEAMAAFSADPSAFRLTVRALSKPSN